MIKLASPYYPKKVYDKITNVLKSGNIVQGKYLKIFENNLKEYIGTKHAVIVSSGTAALHLALLALDIKKGDEVIVPAFTFPATANVVELVNAKPVFVDINLDDFCIDTTKIEEKINKYTKAIIPVHEFGQSLKMDEIAKISKKHNLKIIEDAACAIGTEFKGKKVGTFGDISCFSFHPRKIITTGEGGLIITDNDDLAKKARILRNHGMLKNKPGIDLIIPGLNYRMTDFQAVLGISQLEIIDDLLDNRIQTAKQYNELLKDLKWITCPKDFHNRKMIYQSYHILLKQGINRDDLIKYLLTHGIESNFGAQAINCMSFYRDKYNLYENDFPKAVKAYKTGLSLPIGKHLSDNDIKYIVDKLSSFVS